MPALQSRCTKFRFAPLKAEQIQSRLQYVIDSEKINNKIKFNFGFSKGISDWMCETEFLRQNKIY